MNGCPFLGLTGPHSNYKMLAQKVKQIKASTPVNSEIDAELVDLSYDLNNTIKTIRQQQKHEFWEKEVSEMMRRYHAGETVYDLAEAFGCHRSTVSAVLKRNGVTVTLVKSEKIFDPAEAAALYEAGMKSKEIGKRFGVSEQTIRDCLKKQGIKMRTRWDYPR